MLMVDLPASIRRKSYAGICSLLTVILLSFSTLLRGQSVDLILPVGHTGGVTSMKYSPNGKVLLTGSRDHSVKLWDAATGKLLRTLTGHNGEINSLDISPDGKLIATAGGFELKIWNLESGMNIYSIDLDSIDRSCKCAIEFCEFSPDGKWVIASFRKTLVIISTEHGTLSKKLLGQDGQLNEAHFSKDGTKIVSTSEDGTAVIWNAADGKLLQKLSAGKTNLLNAQFSPDAKKVVTASRDNVPRVWNAETGELLKELKGHEKRWWDTERMFYNAKFTPDGKYIITASIVDETALIWSATDYELVQTLRHHPYGVADFDISPDGNTLAVTPAGNMRGAKIWNISTGDLITTLPGVGKNSLIRFGPGSSRVATAGETGVVNFYDGAPEDRSAVSFDIVNDTISDVKCSPNGDLIAIAGGRSATLWDAATGQLVRKLQVTHGPECRCEVKHVKFSADGTLILTDGSTVQLWNANTGELVKDFGGYQGYYTSAYLSNDGKFIWIQAANFLDQLDAHSFARVRLVKDKKFLIDGVALRPDNMVAYAAGGKIYFMDGNTGKTVKTTYRANKVFSWSPQGNFLIAGGEDESPSSFLTQIDLSKGIEYLSGEWSDVRFDGVTFDEANKTGYAFGNEVFSFGYGKENFDPLTELGPRQTVIVSRDGNVRVMTNDNNVDVKIGEVAYTFQAHDSPITKTTFAKQDKVFITISSDRKGKIWLPETFTASRPRHPGKLLFTSNGSPVNFRSVMLNSGDSSLLIEERYDYLSAMNFTVKPNGEFEFVDYKHEHSKLWNLRTGDWKKIFTHFPVEYRNTGSPVVQSETGAIVTSNPIEIWDGRKSVLIDSGYYASAEFLPGSRLIWNESEVYEGNEQKGILHVIHLATKKPIKLLDAKSGFISSYSFNAAGNKVVALYGKGPAQVWDMETGKVIARLEGLDSIYGSVQMSPDGTRILAVTRTQTGVWNGVTGKQLLKVEGDVIFGTGNTLISWSGSKIKLIDLISGKVTRELPQGAAVSQVFLSPDRKRALIWEEDETIVVLSTQSWTPNAKFKVKGTPVDMDWNANVILSREGQRIMLLSLLDGHEIVSLFDIGEKDWVVTHPSGLFDASEGAMSQLYFVQGLDMIEFGQLKDRYYEPGLWKKVMRNTPLRSVAGLKGIDLPPDIRLGSVDPDGYLPIELVNRGGGIGEVSVFIQGKEVEKDARSKGLDPNASTATLKFYVGNNKALVNGTNYLAVKAWNKDHWVVSRSQLIPYQKSGAESYVPNIHILTCGISDYAGGPDIDLTYAAKDSRDMTVALELGARKLFGSDKVHIYHLASPADKDGLPTKQNIIEAFKKIAATAHPLDVLVVYLSGHGINLGGTDGGDWHYLTQEAFSANPSAYNDPAIVAQTTLSSNEWVELFKSVPAAKQVFIVDACASGRVVDNLMAKKDIPSSTLRALDRMKDRTGMHIITGCTADAVSFEASRYGQGILTYSLLEGLRGAALRSNEFVDVSTLFQYARDRVPDLAAGIGGIQTPMIFSPSGSESFDVGELDDAAKNQIPISKIRPVYFQSNFQDEDQMTDVLQVGKKVDEQLNDLTAKGADAPLIFVGVRDYPDGCQLVGRYSQKAGVIALRYLKRCGGKDASGELSGKDVDEVIRKLIEKIR